MFEVLKLLHVLGWSSWFGLAAAEAIVGARVRRASEPAIQETLAALWARVGKVLVTTMALAVVFGLATFFYEGAQRKGGLGELMGDRQMIFVHVMLGLGLLAGALALVAGNARTRAIAAVKAGDAGAFAKSYKLASMLSGMSSLAILVTIAEVYLRTAF